MRLCTILAAAILTSPALTAQSDTPEHAADFQALHAAWFDAFDRGEGAKMDQMEAPNLVLGMPDGSFWKKTEPRARTEKARTPDSTRKLVDSTVREFGETALLTGILITKDIKDPKQSDISATTVVFVKNDGKWLIASAQWTPKTPPPKS
jgi:hypothetical protein